MTDALDVLIYFYLWIKRISMLLYFFLITFELNLISESNLLIRWLLNVTLFLIFSSIKWIIYITFPIPTFPVVLPDFLFYISCGIPASAVVIEKQVSALNIHAKSYDSQLHTVMKRTKRNLCKTLISITSVLFQS